MRLSLAVIAWLRARLLPPLDARRWYYWLADRDAGSARQWLWLELAAVSPPQWPLAPLDRLAMLLARWLGVATIADWLQARGLAGMSLYRSPSLSKAALARDAGRDGVLLLGCLALLLLGLATLPAGRGVWLGWALFAGSLAWGGDAWQRARRQPPAIVEGADLPGPEAVLGLSGQLVSRGLPLQAAEAIVQALRDDPERQLRGTDLCRWLALQPAQANWPAGRGLLAALAFAAGGLPGWLGGRILHGGWALATVALACLCLLWLGQYGTAWRQRWPLLAWAGAAGAACWGLAALLAR